MHIRNLFRTFALVAAVGLGAPLVAAAPAGAASEAAASATSKRVVVYYQTQFNNGTYVSPRAMTDNNTGVTDVVVGAIHLNGDGSVALNDDSPDNAKFDQMWSDLGAMQAKGVRVEGMVGGAAQGSFQRLDSDFDTYYPKLKNVITTHHLDGVDLDVEESMSLAGVEHLIDQLHTDFGAGFTVTLAPVATALNGGGNLSGFSYDSLYRDRGSSISWFNTQFYCGWGSLSSTSGYDGIISHGVVPADKVVAGTLTNAANCGSGYVPMDTLKSTVSSLAQKYPSFGGVAGWEYFNSDPGGTSAPWEWAANMSAAMG
ncbi:glycosyl hydrolase family 18 protein [Streptomyces sp. 8L]|uniref:glycosyl hydrolase family 18 protein n=1 Tax=Streptomyces sp. 8L TaxID=2877242 RepID=UPI001CD5D167|nr:glycosyl hydrolase family 18 protein [Streptomyces sp. 8L]MCA1221519.1 chitinase [Streptomyces sp. 8L]